jgi:hypothetical protein
MARTTNSTFRPKTDTLRGDDVYIHNQDRYAAVLNPTDDAVQAWGYGRRAIFLPNELYDPTRMCIQFIERRLARKMVYNQRRLLEVVSFEQGKRLLKRARELDDFYAAYAELTGRTLSKAAQEIRRKKALSTLRQQLDRLGIPVKREWDVATCKAILRNPELAFDIDAGPAPRVDDDENLPFLQPPQTSRKSAPRVPESGLDGDFIDPESLDDSDAPPEQVMAEGLLREEHGMAPFVEEKHFEEADEREVESVEAVAKRVRKHQEDTDEAKALREQLKVLGVKVHARTRDTRKLRKMLDQAKAGAAAG